VTTYTVTTKEDVTSDADGVLSLREAIALANADAAPDEIVFSLPPFAFIFLRLGQLEITSDLHRREQ
jgi:hypothetical protein